MGCAWELLRCWLCEETVSVGPWLRECDRNSLLRKLGDGDPQAVEEKGRDDEADLTVVI